MPYIKKEKREPIFSAYYEVPCPECPDGLNTAIVSVDKIETPGDLNFAITKMIRWYLDEVKNHDYESYNEVVGVLECCKLEFYRRMAAPYEEEKIDENGDVY